MRFLRLGVAVGLAGACLAPFAADLEGSGLDLLFRLRGPRAVPPEVLIVTIDKESAEALGLAGTPARCPRSLHARLIEGLAQRGAAVLVFDVFFRDRGEKREDLRFAQALSRAGRVILCSRLDAEVVGVGDRRGKPEGRLTLEGVLEPTAVLADAALASAPWPLPQEPSKVRSFWAFKPSAGGCPTLPVVAFQAFALRAHPAFIDALDACAACAADALRGEPGNGARAGGLQETVARIRDGVETGKPARDSLLRALKHPTQRLPDARLQRLLASLADLYAGGDARYLNYYGPARTIPTLSYARVVEELDRPGRAGALDVRGRAVFIGCSESSWPRQKDGFRTPYSRADGLQLSGVEIAATAFANLVENMPLRPPSVPEHLVGLFLWGLIVGWVAFSFRVGPSVAAVTAVGGAWFAMTLWAFRAGGHWYPLVVPLLFQAPLAFVGSVLAKYRAARQGRDGIATAAKQYLPEWIVEAWAEIPDFEVRDEVVYAVCLMTDAKRYATVAETKEEEGGPRELRRWLNGYFEAVFGPILQRGGHIVDIAGDSMLGLWRCDPHASEARRQACLAALEIQRAVAEFNRSAGEHALPTRIGLDLGYVTLGSVGAVGRFAYRATGNAVNTAARLESLNKQLATWTLASEAVIEGLDGIAARDLGEFLLLGQSKAVKVFELRGPTEAVSPEEERLRSAFEEGLRAFYSRSWFEAARAFRKNGGDGPSEFYLSLCEAHRTQPPPEGWAGTVRLDRK